MASTRQQKGGQSPYRSTGVNYSGEIIMLTDSSSLEELSRSQMFNPKRATPTRGMIPGVIENCSRSVLLTKRLRAISSERPAPGVSCVFATYISMAALPLQRTNLMPATQPTSQRSQCWLSLVITSTHITINVGLSPCARKGSVDEPSADYTRRHRMRDGKRLFHTC